MRLFISVLISLSLVQNLAAQCTTFAGTSPNFNLEFCEGDVAMFNPPPDLVNDGNDAFFYTVHLGSEWDESVKAVSLNGTLPYLDSLLTETTYFVSLVIADQQNGGQWIINENDTCLSTTILGTILYHEKTRDGLHRSRH